MEKEIKCKTCNKRYIHQQDWKTEDEKKECLTCLTFKQSLEIYLRTFESFAEEKGLGLEWRFMLTPLNKPKEREHLTDGTPCWCNPKKVSYKDNDTNSGGTTYIKQQKNEK